MRDIHRLERLVLDAIEHATEPPTMAGVGRYIAQRRRVWVWTHAAIVVALLRLEADGTIEARRSTSLDGKVRWIYVLTREGYTRACSACSPLGHGTPGEPDRRRSSRS